MIDVRIIAKKKAQSTGSGGASKSGGMNYGSTATDSTHAAKADRAAYADEAGTAATATTAAEATHAASAGALDENSPTREDFLSAKDDDTAAGLITFEKGLNVGDKTHGIDESGNATLNDVEASDITGQTATVETATTEEIKNSAATVADRALVGGKGFDMYVDEAGKSHLWVDELDVRLKAYFSQLEIRKVSYSGGTTIFSNAGSTIVKVANIENASGVTVAYKCYAKADDGTTATSNWWKVGMQALCKTFNIQAGKYADVANRYYWRLVVGVGQEVLEDGLTYDYVVLSNLETFGARQNTNIPVFGESALADGATALAWGDSGVLSITAQEWSTYYNIVKDLYGEDEAKALPTVITGYDTTGTDAPQPYDVIVQVGDQLHPAQYGNLVKIATSAEDSDPSGTNAPSFEMYHAMSGFAWEALTTRLAPSGNYLNAAYTKFFSGSDWSKAKSVTVYMGEWSDTEHYYAGQQVTYGGQIYTYMNATASTMGVTPDTDGSGWELSVEKGAQGTEVISVVLTPGTVCVSQDSVQIVEVYVYVYRGTTLLNGNTDFKYSELTIVDPDNNIIASTINKTNTEPLLIKLGINAKKAGNSTVTFNVVVDGVEYPQALPVVVVAKGADGTSVTIKGSLTSTDNLPTSGQTAGDGYLIDGYLWVYTGSTTEGAVNGFVNVGQIKGDKGDTTYLHIAYSSTADGSGDFSTTYTAGTHTYIGLYTDTTATGSDNYTAYQWRRFVGEDGLPGSDGWTLRFNPTTLTLADSDLSELSGGNYAVNGGSGVAAAIELLHGATAVTPKNVTLKSATNCAALVSTTGVTVTSIKAIGIAVGEEVVTMPCGSASVAVEVTADGLGTRALTLDISCAYTKNIGQLTISDTQFKSQIATLESRADGVDSDISEINQTASEIKSSVSSVRTELSNSIADEASKREAADNAEASERDAAISTAKTELQSEIKQTAESISLSVTEVKTIADNAQTSADNAQSSAEAAQTSADNAQTNLDGTITQIKKAGIDIESGKITLDADTVEVKNGDETAAMFEDGALNADLINVDHLSTVGTDAHIEIHDGIMEVFGTLARNIKFGIDENGYAVLSYYNNNGQLLYDLGPNGIDTKNARSESFEEIECVLASTIAGTTAFYGEVSYLVGTKEYYLNKVMRAYQSAFFGSPVTMGYKPAAKYSKIRLYRYTAGKLGGAYMLSASKGLTTSALAEEADGKVFTSNSVLAKDGALTNLASGIYVPTSASVGMALSPYPEQGTVPWRWPKCSVASLENITAGVSETFILYSWDDTTYTPTTDIEATALTD